MCDTRDLYGNAQEAALHWVSCGLDIARAFVELNELEKLPASHAILIAAVAILAQRDAHYEEAHGNHRQDSSARAGQEDDERMRNYDWLKNLLIRAYPDIDEGEFAIAVQRIACIAGV